VATRCADRTTKAIKKVNFPGIIEKLQEIQRACRLCPRNCAVNRFEGELGECQATSTVRISSVGPHYGEEHVLVGRTGSGTIFLSHCNLRCIFCQNWTISHSGEGLDCEIEDIVNGMRYLQTIGCNNVNFVTPTHYLPQIVEAIAVAVQRGFDLPLVYNCGGYESVEALKLVEGIFSIYMPDAKFSSPETSYEMCGISDYYEKMCEALIEMHRQVGVLQTNSRNIATRGLLIRHLVMPNSIDESKEILTFIARHISKDSYINIMSQYRPVFKADLVPRIGRHVTEEEMAEVKKFARSLGLHRGF